MIMEYQESLEVGCEVEELQSILGALLAGYPEILKKGSEEPELVKSGEVLLRQIRQSFGDFNRNHLICVNLCVCAFSTGNTKL